MAPNVFLRATMCTMFGSTSRSLRGLPQVTVAVGRHFCATDAGYRCYSASPGLDEKNVGFIGLGNMGVHMASNLVKKGYKVRGFDASQTAINLAAESGVEGSADIAHTVSSAAFVISALPDNEIVRHVYLSENGVIAKAPKGALLVDSSTVDPSVSRELHAAAKDNGQEFMDAPVSGGVMGAKQGTLAFLCGGEEATVSRARSFLLSMGARAVHCGPVGAGELAKLINNQLMGVNMLAAAECYNMAIRLGLDPKVFHEVVNSSTGRSWATEIYCPVAGLVPTAPSCRDYEGGFKTDLLVKDLYLASNLVAESKSPVPLSSLAQQIYRMMQLDGLGNKDFSVAYKYLQEKRSRESNEGGNK